jgi:hypothetical protein
MPVRRRQPRRQETGAAERYRDMGIAAALARPWDYPTACGELAALLRLGYAELPKAAQALVAADVLLAFRLLPEYATPLQFQSPVPFMHDFVGLLLSVGPLRITE